MKAIWNEQIIAQSEDTLVVENNHYFPLESVNKEYLESSETTSFCPWKGEAKYYSVRVDGSINKDAAWFYDSPKEAAMQIKGRVAFWKGVQVTE